MTRYQDIDYDDLYDPETHGYDEGDYWEDKDTNHHVHVPVHTSLRGGTSRRSTKKNTGKEKYKNKGKYGGKKVRIVTNYASRKNKKQKKNGKGKR